jgi:hypothetical protein
MSYWLLKPLDKNGLNELGEEANVKQKWEIIRTTVCDIYTAVVEAAKRGDKKYLYKSFHSAFMPKTERAEHWRLIVEEDIRRLFPDCFVFSGTLDNTPFISISW